MIDSKRIIGERIKQIRLKLSLNQREFAEAIELRQATYSSIERGKSGFAMKTLQILGAKFNVDLNWLLAGKRSMFVKEDIPTAVAQDEPVQYQRLAQRLQHLEERIDKLHKH